MERVKNDETGTQIYNKKIRIKTMKKTFAVIAILFLSLTFACNQASTEAIETAIDTVTVCADTTVAPVDTVVKVDTAKVK